MKIPQKSYAITNLSSVSQINRCVEQCRWVTWKLCLCLTPQFRQEKSLNSYFWRKPLAGNYTWKGLYMYNTLRELYMKRLLHSTVTTLATLRHL